MEYLRNPPSSMIEGRAEVVGGKKMVAIGRTEPASRKQKLVASSHPASSSARDSVVKLLGPGVRGMCDGGERFVVCALEACRREGV